MKSLIYWDQEEMRRLFGVLEGPRDKAMFPLAYHHGLRASEVSLLLRTDLDPRRGRLFVHRVKGSLSGVYPLEPADLRRLRAYLRTRQDESPYLFLSNRGTPPERRTYWDLMQKYGQRAGLPKEKLRFHSLRHSIAVHLLDAGADVAFVCDRLGHANIQNTHRYLRYTTATRDSQTRRLFSSPHIV